MVCKLKKAFLVFVAPMLFAFASGSEGAYRFIPNNSFKSGEKFTFRIHYSIFNAGEAIFETSSELYKVNDRDCYKITVFGRSTGAFDMMMPIRDTWGTYMDTAAFISHRSYRDIAENNYRLKEYVNFFPMDGVARVERHRNGVKTEEYSIPTNIHDIVSGFYFLRTIDYNHLEKGTIIRLNAFFENELYDFKIRYEGKKILKTKFGKTEAFKLVPVLPANSLFDGGNAISCWLSADENKIPLKVKAKMLVGAVEIDLEHFSGLKSPSCFKK